MESIDDAKADFSDEKSTTDREGPNLEDHRKSGSKNGKGRIQSYTWILVTFWTLIMVISLGWNLYQARQEIKEMALTAARINFDKDLLYRQWATIHGGVYVPVTPGTPPNPFLVQVPERDLTTPFGSGGFQFPGG